MMQKIYRDIFKRYPGNPILTADNWPYPVNSVFNAAAAAADGKTLLLARVEDRRGISHLNIARSEDGINGWEIDKKPAFLPSPKTHPEEIWGVEDPRITYLDEMELWVVCYTAFSNAGPLVSICTTKDFKKFKRLGVVMVPENKDAAVFPKRFKGRWAMIHRPVPTLSSADANIWISFSPDLKHWGSHQILIKARKGAWWDANKIGLSAPPVETSEGWLILYHGVRTTASGSIYRLGLALLDIDDPLKVTHRSDEWVFGPLEHYEREGDVDDVVFPCGWILDKDSQKVRMYYGGADTFIALATADLKDILGYLKRCPTPPPVTYE